MSENHLDHKHNEKNSLDCSWVLLTEDGPVDQYKMVEEFQEWLIAHGVDLSKDSTKHIILSVYDNLVECRVDINYSEQNIIIKLKSYSYFPFFLQKFETLLPLNKSKNGKYCF